MLFFWFCSIFENELLGSGVPLWCASPQIVSFEIRGQYCPLVWMMPHGVYLIILFEFVGHFDNSDLPTCWYTWLILCLIPVMFIGGLAVQLGITGKGRDHREGT